MKHFQGKIFVFFSSSSFVFFFPIKDLSILWFILTTVSSMTISPHGGYLSIDEGTSFYIECIGNDPQWIIGKRLTLDSAR